MIVLIVERVPPALRGELTRWLLEPKAGVFVGRLPTMVRDKLWQQVCEKAQGGSALLIYHAQNEQGFALRLWGAPERAVSDYDGLALIHRLVQADQ